MGQLWSVTQVKLSVATPGRSLQPTLQNAQTFRAERAPLLNLSLALGVGELHAINDVRDPLAFGLAAKHGIATDDEEEPDDGGQNCSEQRGKSKQANAPFSPHARTLADDHQRAT